MSLGKRKPPVQQAGGFQRVELHRVFYGKAVSLNYPQLTIDFSKMQPVYSDRLWQI